MKGDDIMNNNDPNVIRSLMEQGDLGLFGDPLSEEDQKAFQQQKKKSDDEDADKQ